jgi:acyl-CoA dehydrogenase
MNFVYSDKTKKYLKQLTAFFDEHIYLNDAVYQQMQSAADRWSPVPIVEELKQKARAARLSNMFMIHVKSAGVCLSNLEYAPLCEMMGCVHWSSEVFNCSAPDTGNMTRSRFVERRSRRSSGSILCSKAGSALAFP